MDFDEIIDQFDTNEYEEVFPNDKEYQKWIEGIERDYADEVASIDVDSNDTIHCDDDTDEDESL